MVRCDDFYRKWQQAGNFCEKHPDTAARIDRFLDEIIPLLKEEVAKSEILNSENTPIGGILTENASRPLFREKSPEIRKKAVEQIKTVAEEKVMDGRNPQVTEREVAQIVAEVKGEPHNEVETAKEITTPHATEPEIPLIELEDEPRPDPVEAVREWQEGLAARGGSMGLPSRSIFTDLLELKSIQDMASYLQCPKCGKPGVLVWQCCGSTIDEALDRAQDLADAKMGSKGVTT
jgi:gas vesicle protein